MSSSLRYELRQPVINPLEIKKSQFITWMVPISSKEEAKSWLEKSKTEYPDARHHCYAYVMGDTPNNQTAAMSDDGEPSGTAGKPMLSVLQHKPLNNVLVIVIRYFGGIKLGAGGLVRAYSQAVEQAYQIAEKEDLLAPVIKSVELKVSISFAEEQWLRHQLDLCGGEIIEVSYSENVTVTIKIAQSEQSTMQDALIARSIEFKELP